MENVIKHVCDCLRVNLKKTHEPCLFYWLNTTYMYMSLIIRGIWTTDLWWGHIPQVEHDA